MKTLIITVLTLLSFLAVQSQVTIDVIGAGVHDVQVYTLVIPDFSTVDQVIVEAVYKSKIPFAGKQVKFYDSDDTFFADLVPVELELNFSSIKDDFLGYAQATFPGASLGPEGITLDQLNNFSSIHSFTAYIYRSDPGAGKYSVADFTHVYMFYNDVANAYVYDIPISTAFESRDVTAKVVITEMLWDTRRCIIQVSDGYQTEEVTLRTWDPLLGDALNIENITLYDVPGDVTNITVTIYSPAMFYGVNRGDSFISGAVVIDVDDDPLCPPAGI